MARTTDQIFNRIAELYPAIWVVGTLEEGAAIYYGISAIFSTLETSVDHLVDSAYVQSSSGNQVDLHAIDRGLVRAEGESDANLQGRVRSFEDQVTVPAIENGVNALLFNKGAYIEEGISDGGFMDRQVTFMDRGQSIYPIKKRFFILWMPLQSSSLLLNAFMNRQRSFMDRQNAFIENLDNMDAFIYKRVHQYVDSHRSAGVEFKIIIF